MRSIPACAGEPVRRRPRFRIDGVYPRVCGGTYPSRLHRTDPARSIPACAGEPSGRLDSRSSQRVYPRVCGGTPLVAYPYSPTKGLSPRVRGNLSCFFSPFSVYGSIPACAGEPLLGSCTTTSCTVYPRVCGGTFHMVNSLPDVDGLSPRVRGNLRLQLQGRNSRGSIPACAGEPARRADAVGPGRVYPRVCGGTIPLPGLQR